MFGISSLINAIANVGQTALINQRNAEGVAATNASNEKQVRMQNAAAKKEAELAYKRSSAPNQVNLMRSAGMSRAGAISALNGGGSYTPAPVAASTAQAATTQPADLSALSNVGQMIQNMQIHKDLNRDQLDYNKDKDMLKGIFDTIDSNSDQFGSAPTLKDVYGILNDKQRNALTNPKIREQVNDFINQSFEQRKNQHTISLFPYETHDKEVQRELKELDMEVRRSVQKGKITAEQQEVIAKMAQARLSALQSNITADAFEKMDKETLQRYAETRATLEWLSHIGEMSAEKVIDKLRTIVGL